MCFKTMVFGCGEVSPSEGGLLPIKAKVDVRYPSPAGPWARAAGGGSPEEVVTHTHENDS